MGQSISFDRMADRYDDSRGGLRRGERFAITIEPRFGPGPFLEIGIGTAAIASPLADLGHPPLGADISPDMLAKALPRVGSVLTVADAAQLPFRTATVPNVLACWVLHLVGDPEGVAAEVARVLQPSGRFVVIDATPRWRDDDILDIQQRIFGFKREVDVEAAIAAADELTLVERTETAMDEFETSPNEVADQIERRTWSSLWNIDEATWTETVEPVIDDLRALPEPDRRRVRANAHAVLVYQRDRGDPRSHNPANAARTGSKRGRPSLERQTYG